MRAFLIGLQLLIMVSAEGHAQSTKPFITLEAASKSQGNSAATAWATDYGSYDVTFRQSANIGVKLRNMGRAEARILFRVVFFAKVAGTNAKYVFSMGDQILTPKAGQELSMVLPSPLMERRDQNYQALGVRYQEGSKYEGWLVQILSPDGKEVYRQLGSTSYLEDLAKTPAFDGMVDDYKASAKPE